MKKLHLDTLAVDSFATAAVATRLRGTVAAHQTAQYCPDSWDGTCWISCWDSCQCETGAGPCV